MYEMTTRSHPVRCAVAQPQMRQSFRRRETAVGDVAGKSRTLVTEQCLADRRMDPVGADQKIALVNRSILKLRANTRFGLRRANAAPRRLQDTRRQRIGKDGQQIGAMKMVVR